jgi:hypothetical protein
MQPLASRLIYRASPLGESRPMSVAFGKIGRCEARRAWGHATGIGASRVKAYVRRSLYLVRHLVARSDGLVKQGITAIA